MRAVSAAIMGEWGWTDKSRTLLAPRRIVTCPQCGEPMLPEDLANAAMCGRHTDAVAEAVPGPGYPRAELAQYGLEQIGD